MDVDKIKLRLKSCIKGLLINSKICEDQETTLDLILQSPHDFYEIDIDNLEKINISATPLLSILYIYKFLRNPYDIDPLFYKTIKTAVGPDVRTIVFSWVVCYLIQHIMLNNINKTNNKLVNLKVNSYKTCVLLMKSLSATPEDIQQLVATYNLKNADADEPYKSLSYVFWIIDIISKYEGQNHTGGLNIEKIMADVKCEHTSIIAAILGCYTNNFDTLNTSKLEELFKKMNL